MCVTSSNKGFTLLELLVAVVLMGILTGAIYGSYFSVVKARDRSGEAMEGRRELGATLDLIRREVASSVYTSGDKLKRTRFIVEDRDNFGKAASTLEMTTVSQAPILIRPESGVYNVQYRLLEKNKRFLLTRKERDMLKQQQDSDTAYPQMEQVSSFLVECYNKSTSTWVKSWNTELNKRLPDQVRITIQVEENGKPVEFRVLATPMVTGP